MRRVTIRASLMSVRSAKRRREVPLDQFPNHTKSLAPKIEEMVTFEKAVSELPEDERTMVLLREVEELTHNEIGKLLEITAKASRTRHCRAMKHLREWLRKHA